MEIGGQMAKAGQHPNAIQTANVGTEKDGGIVTREACCRSLTSRLLYARPDADGVKAKKAPTHPPSRRPARQRADCGPRPDGGHVGRGTKSEREAIPIRQGAGYSGHEHYGPTVTPMTSTATRASRRGACRVS